MGSDKFLVFRVSMGHVRVATGFCWMSYSLTCRVLSYELPQVSFEVAFAAVTFTCDSAHLKLSSLMNPIPQTL